jgi:hypothetical protein
VQFFLGTHEPSWLSRTAVPLFVSRRRLGRLRRLPRALGPWALDSGGFTELNLHGRWQVEPPRYADEVANYADRIGQLSWAAIQDWMCEPFVLAKTGKTVGEHQALTIASYLNLRELAPSLPWAPVLQGWAIDDYLDHVEQYRRSGVDLASEPIIGVGSVCRRQATEEAAELIVELSSVGLHLHAFGFKVGGLRRCGAFLESSDSLAWSYQATKRPPLVDCTHQHCNNCLRYALHWRGGVMALLGKPCQDRFIFR